MTQRLRVAVVPLCVCVLTPALLSGCMTSEWLWGSYLSGSTNVPEDLETLPASHSLVIGYSPWSGIGFSANGHHIYTTSGTGFFRIAAPTGRVSLEVVVEDPVLSVEGWSYNQTVTTYVEGQWEFKGNVEVPANTCVYVGHLRLTKTGDQFPRQFSFGIRADDSLTLTGDSLNKLSMGLQCEKKLISFEPSWQQIQTSMY